MDYEDLLNLVNNNHFIGAHTRFHSRIVSIASNFKKELEKHGLKFTGMSPDGLLTEIVELKNHPWFIGVQFHPELKSRPFNPHPLFASFVKASMNNKN